MREKAGASDLNLDALEPRFARISEYAALMSGYTLLLFVAAFVGAIIAFPAVSTVLWIKAEQDGVPFDPVLAAVYGVVAFNIGPFLAASGYLTLSAILQLNRLNAVALLAPLLGFVLQAAAPVLNLVKGLALLVAAARAPFGLHSLEALAFGATLAAIGVTAAWGAFYYVRLVCLYFLTTFSRERERRLLKIIFTAQTGMPDAKNRILGGGTYFPTARRASIEVRAFNLARGLCVGLPSALLIFVVPSFANVVLQSMQRPIGDLPPFWFAGSVGLTFGGLGALLLVSWISANAARRFLDAARSRARFALDEMRDSDPRPPTLFLRPFWDDQVTLSKRKKGGHFALEPQERALDHVLVEEFSWAGPVIAIGRPGEKTLPFGAARTFLANDQWQREALNLAAVAKHVVIVIDDTPGVQWEIDQVSGEAFRTKTLFLFHPKFKDPEKNRSIVGAIAQKLAVDITVAKAPILAIWFNETGHAQVFRSSTFSAEAFTLSLRGFFRAKFEAGELAARSLRRTNPAAALGPFFRRNGRATTK